MPMCYANRAKAWIYGAITTVSGVAGAVLGYLIGMFLWQNFGHLFFNHIPGFSQYFDTVGQMYQDNAELSLFIAAFTPVPFKVFTVAAGVYADKINIMTLIVVSFIGRGTRYFIMAALIFYLGQRAKVIIEKHFKICTIILAVLAMAGLIVKFSLS